MMVVMDEHAVKLLYLRFVGIYGDKFYKPYHDNDFKSIWYREWLRGLGGIDASIVEKAVDQCSLDMTWPPSIAEFRRLCERGAGIPSVKECLESCIRDEIDHPLTYLVYRKIGKWAIRNDKQDILNQKFEEAYQESLSEFRANQSDAQKALENYHSAKMLEYDNNKPTPAEIKSFKKNYEQWKNKADENKKSMEAVNHPEWEAAKVTKGNHDFCSDEYDKKRSYLVDLKESEASTLNTANKYDRIRFLRENEGAEMIERIQRELSYKTHR